jgi:hypothetical protein
LQNYAFLRILNFEMSVLMIFSQFGLKEKLSLFH